MQTAKRIKAAIIVLALTSLAACSETPVKPVFDTAPNEKNIEIREWHTSNGVRVLYVHAGELPMLDVQVTFDAGSVHDGKQYGLAKMTNSMLSHGAYLGKKKLTVEDIAERFDSVGAQFSTSAGRNTAKISLRSLTDKKWLQQSIATMQAVINHPAFDNKEFKRLKKQWMVALEGRKQSPGTIANDQFYKMIYGSHPYAHPAIGTSKTIKKLKRTDLISFYKNYYVASNALVTIIGDVSQQKAAELAETLVAKLPVGKKAAELPKVQPLVAAAEKHIQFPSSQTHILVGQPGVDRKDKDYFVLYVANHILGGSGFSSRIVQEIREKRGLAYSSYSYFIPLKRKGPFIMGLQTRNDKAKQALAILKKTLRDFIENGATEEELQHAKRNITGGFPLKVDSNSDIAGYLAMIGFYQLPLSYLQDFNKKIEAITLEQVNDAIKRRIDPDKMITVMVGNSGH